ncbi:hypothetical protein HK104_007419, partial [Borealophlyctis nickersoniae]
MSDLEPRFRALDTITYESGTLISLTFLFLVSLGAAVFNSFLIVLFIRDRSLRSPATFLVLNLSFIDWCLGVLNSTIYGTNLAASLISLALLGLERWLAMVKQRRLTHTHALSLILATWTWSLLLASFPYWFSHSYVLETSTLYFAGNWADRSPPGLVFTTLCLMNVTLPLLTFGVSYVQIWKVIREQNERWRGLDEAQ